MEYLNYVAEKTRKKKQILDETWEMYQDFSDLEELEQFQEEETINRDSYSDIPDIILNGSLIGLYLGQKVPIITDDWASVMGQIKYFFDYWKKEQMLKDSRIMRHTVTPMYGWVQQGRYRKAIREGKRQMRRIAPMDERTCPECSTFTNKGWVPINTLPRPGMGCSCLDRCRCELQFR